MSLLLYVLQFAYLVFAASIASCLPSSLGPGSDDSGVLSAREQWSLDAKGVLPGWYDPRSNGGRMLDDQSSLTYQRNFRHNFDCIQFTTRYFREPLNVIISGHSDPFILTEAGFHYYAKSIGFSEECLGLHYGNIHRADLGDGDGRKEELFLARQHYFPVWGTCWESVAGGNHFRAWKQNGTLANSGGWFLAVSKEEDSSKNHRIVDDGYNIGRDLLVQKASAGSHWKGINHGIAQDGRVAVLTIERA
ncbi:hypothetical protein A7U60_g4314 [Sanghuangporus baumii]|uniref:Secreted protein n=1 Tax=Sanghuangporus baumii TaxID=108892 RepID=A0A9Q5N5E0_SANBA|nr:hypothetical protein A7U60_g4314 [Sanghuangporus baumii]